MLASATMSEEQGFKVTDRRGRDREPAAPPAASPPPPPEPTPGPRAPSAAESPDLRGLFVMLASSALVGLGEAGDPATGLRRVDLDQAQDAIEILLLLREKTRGNLTPDEARLLEDVLYDLELRFVEASRGAGGGGHPPR